MIITLTRIAQDAKETRGYLTDEENKQLCVTLERPDLGNQHNVSRIPAGRYQTARMHSPHMNVDLFQVLDVPGRGNIEIHFGNYVTDSEGCILLGTSFADINSDGEIDITASQDAFKKFMLAMTGVDGFTLVIVDPE